MKRIKTILAFVAAFFCLCSCGLMELDGENLVMPTDMHFDRDTVYVMKGRTFSLTPIYTPDSVYEKRVFWTVGDVEIVGMQGSDFIGLSEGWTTVAGQNIYNPEVTDTCHVCVTPCWYDPVKVYPYETIIYASTNITGVNFDPEKMVVAAYVSNEYRGVGQVMEWNGVKYLRIRIGSNIFSEEEPLDEIIRLRLYNLEDFTCKYLTPVIDFDGDTHGSLNNLITLIAN